jgi:serine phosphatase RsbU (regulator of sigma subunit)
LEILRTSWNELPILGTKLPILGRQFQNERTVRSIEAGRGLSANALLEKLIDDVARYVGDAEPHDDLTIVVVQVE